MGLKDKRFLVSKIETLTISNFNSTKTRIFTSLPLKVRNIISYLIIIWQWTTKIMLVKICPVRIPELILVKLNRFMALLYKGLRFFKHLPPIQLIKLQEILMQTILKTKRASLFSAHQFRYKNLAPKIIKSLLLEKNLH